MLALPRGKLRLLSSDAKEGFNLVEVRDAAFAKFSPCKTFLSVLAGDLKKHDLHLACVIQNTDY